ncbi:MAG: ArsC family reductase [Gammaproteobacteria bacterium]
MTTLYGIKNCDTVKKARRWLDDQAIAYRFHDIRADGLARERLQLWIRELGWENLLNRRSTTWRKLPETTRADIDRATATRLMLEQPTIIRRPILDNGGKLYLGFDSNSYRTIFHGTSPA